MTSLITSFGRRVPASSAEAPRRQTTRTDLHSFLTAFAGGFVFFSILFL